ncbi:MAG TPA: J domain-containing protein [Vicinamibacterales bacterium]|nr:J domain-containing protein [Vicinamibacterales bacterium]
MEFKDYYGTLGVPKMASAVELKRAYRKLARESHPDMHPGDVQAEARFKDINEAYEVLGDPAKRKKYDQLGANWRDYEQAGRNGGPVPGTGTHRTVTADELRDLFGAEDPFSDFFHAFFGGGGGARTGGRRARRAERGTDVEHPLELTLEEAFQGTTRHLRLSDHGADRTVQVRIPAGVRDGSRVRVAGEGGRGRAGGSAGDLFLVVRLLPHPTMERRGQDLYTKVSVPVTTAVLGGDVDVATLSGGSLRLKVPPMSQAGQVFRLRTHGMPTPGKPTERGDLYATLELRIPAALSDEARAHYEALRALEGRPS